jgi:serine phosphatase RsbU (regulator of sigma subunit)
MPGRRDGTPPAFRRWISRALRYRPRTPVERIAVLAVLLLAVTTVFVVVNRPGLAIYLYALIPLVLGVHWFRLPGGLAVAAVATLSFIAAQLLLPSDLSVAELWVAAVNRSVVFIGVAVLVAVLLQRERALAVTVRAQQDEITELASLRAALTPTDVPVRPRLEFATSFTPADGLVAGDFFLVVEGPSGSTTVAVGDVVGHGLDAARCAAFVRAGLATFARFTSDPVELLQLANAALVEHTVDGAHFVTAVCLNIGTSSAGDVCWASAGHDVPWFLDTGSALPGGRVGVPLGIGPDALKLEAGHASLPAGGGILIFTDGLVEGRSARRGPAGRLELFGEERARRVVRDHRGAPAAHVLEALVDAVGAFAGGPLADDLCLVAVRSNGPSPSPRD